MTIDFERNAGGYENVDAEDAHNTNWQEEASTTMSECECEDCTGDVDDHDVAESDHWDGYDPAAEMYADHIAAFYGGE